MKRMLTKAVTHREFLKLCGLAIVGAGTGQIVTPPLPVSAETFTTLTVTGDTCLATESGKVGVGTANPNALLTLFRNDATVTDFLTLQQSGVGDASMRFRITGVVSWEMGADNSDSQKFKIARSNGAGLGTSDILTIDSNGNVGIGTANPGAKLDAAGDVRTSGNFIVGDSNHTIYQAFQDTMHITAWNGLKVDIKQDGPAINRFYIDYLGNISVNGALAIDSAGVARQSYYA